MDEGDHSECPVELLACSEHASEELQPTDDAITFTDKAGRRTVGFCWWCDRDFYSMEEVFEHNHSKPCPEFQKALNGTLEDTEMCDLSQLLNSLPE